MREHVEQAQTEASEPDRGIFYDLHLGIRTSNDLTDKFYQFLSNARIDQLFRNFSIRNGAILGNQGLGRESGCDNPTERRCKTEFRAAVVSEVASVHSIYHGLTTRRAAVFADELR